MKCPFCNQIMRKTAGTPQPNGKTLVTYVCPNRSMCGAVVQVEEG